MEKQPLVTPEQYPELFELHRQYLKHLEQPNPKLMVCFAGAPGSGKSTMAKRVEERYKGVRVATKDIRDLLGKFDENIKITQANEIVQDYHKYVLEQLLDIPNGLLVLDSGIDRKYQKIFDFARQHGYPQYTVDFDLDRNLLERRIRENKNEPENYLAELDRWIEEHEQFQQNIAPDATVTEDTDIESVLQDIGQRLESR